MPSPQYNPRRQQRESPKRLKRSGASPGRGDAARVNIPWWLWIIVGTALGIFVSFLVRLAQTPPPAATAVALPKAERKSAAPNTAQKAETKSAATADAKNTKAGDDSAKPDTTKTVTKFDFYTLLPEREVIVPNGSEALEAADRAKVATGPQQAVAAASTEQLFLQAGSFRSAQEADRRRGQLKALGLDAKVEQVTANADTWYRVQAGPFTSRDQLSKTRDQLSAAGIETLVLRQK